MFNEIVVGTDGSDSADIAVREATKLAALTNATLHIVCAYRPVALGSVALSDGHTPPNFDLDLVNRSVAAQAEQTCEDAAADARNQNVKYELHPVPGEPADTLIRVAKDVAAELLVIGNRGMSGRRRFMLGSVPNKVSHHSPCNLLIIDTTSD